MKQIIKISILLFCVYFIASCGGKRVNTGVTANTTITFKVWGNCDMCKDRIEEALQVDGIRTSDWNKDSKILTASFDSTIISRDKIEKNIAAVGHDTENQNAEVGAYADLPECCKYEKKK